VLSGQTSFDRILNAKLSQSRLPPRSRPEVQLGVALDNQFDPTFTIVEVKALDRPGLLAHIARALTDLDLRVDRSIIATEGNRAIDTFYVADAMGQKLEAARLPEVRQRLLDDLRQRLDG
ncbi:MAG: ACT domain-containing protein, partial [Gemmatimonadales bacterium]